MDDKKAAQRALQGLDHSMPRDQDEDMDTTMAQNTDGERGLQTDPTQAHDDSGPDASNASEIGANDQDTDPVDSER